MCLALARITTRDNLQKLQHASDGNLVGVKFVLFALALRGMMPKKNQDGRVQRPKTTATLVANACI